MAVYLGATRSGRLLAIKVIHPERTGETEFRARFRREVSAATKVRSHRTAAVVDFDVDAARPSNPHRTMRARAPGSTAATTAISCG